MNAIEISDVHKSFGDLHVLRGIELEIPRGECVILLGANGSGKSTLIRCLNGLARPDSGLVRINGELLTGTGGMRLRRLRRQIGVVFQHFNLVPNISALQNVLYGALGQQRGGLLRTLPAFAPRDLRERAMACLDRVSMAEYAATDCRNLSGGQQQRVAIARTLLQNPEVLIADEPVASLDPRAGSAVMELLIEIVRKRGMTVLCSLHQLELASEYGDRVVGMKAGRIELDGARESIGRAEMSGLYHGVVRVDHAPSHISAAIAAESA